MEQFEMRIRVDRRTAPQAPEIRFIRLKEVTEICSMSKSTIYEAIRHGGFPKPVRLYGRSSAWIKSEVLQWAQRRIAEFRATNQV